MITTVFVSWYLQPMQLGQITTVTSTSGQDTASTSERNGSVPPISGQDTEVTSIIGFVAVLIILVSAVLAVICLCTCYGVCKLHSQPAEDTTPIPASRRGLIPVPSPGVPLPPSRPPLHGSRPPLQSSIMPPREQPRLSAKNKSRSFQNSPYYMVGMNASTPPPSGGLMPCPPLQVRHLAHHIPPSASYDSHLCQRGSRQTTSHYIPTQFKTYTVPSTPLAGPVGMTQHSDNSADVTNVAIGGTDKVCCSTPKTSGDSQDFGETKANHVRSYSTEV